MSVIISRRDLDFILYEVLEIETICARERFKDHSREIFDQVLDTAAKLAENEFYPIAKDIDIHEPEFVDGAALHPEFSRTAIDHLRDGGFFGAGFQSKLGGLQLPYVITQGVAAYLGASTGGLSIYLNVTIAAANLLVAHASQKQVEKFVPPMVEGRFFGTMCLSEPHAGSSLADIRMRAEDNDDGTFRLFGDKMWITGGDHSLSENIVHLVLAKLPGAPDGVKGISLFIVPKFLMNEDGSLAELNEVKLIGVNHKMGCRGNVNTALSFGDQNGAVGYLIGEPGNGLFYMFHMMNEARIAVGLSASATAYTGYLHALEYAKDRRQGRPLTNRDPKSEMIPIIEHADVKRILLQQKSYCEGGLALCLYGAFLIDCYETETDPAEKNRINLLLEILTPVIKSWPSEYGPRVNDQAIQIHGGYGYTREYPVERLYRDNRLNAIHEGTKGIHGLDLMGRKVSMKNGAALEMLETEIFATIEKAMEVKKLNAKAQELKKAWAEMRDIAMLSQKTESERGRDVALANATLYLDVFGHVIIAWIWLKQAMTVLDSQQPEKFRKGKLQAFKYFYTYELPTIYPHCELLRKMDETCLEMEDTWF